MLHINIVTEPAPGWILRRIAEMYAMHLPHATVATEADNQADINFYINYALFERKTKKDVGFFTHREKEGIFREKFDVVAKDVDWCIAMCDKTACLLPKEKTTVIPIAPDPQFQKEKIIFGVVAREYSSDRKRTHWIEELKKIDGIEIRFTNGEIPWHDMPRFYDSIDYLLILSDNEGGPVPLLEALAMGVPVISSDVGFASDYTVIRYRTLDELKGIVQKLVISKDAWEISAWKVYELFMKLI